MRTIISYDIVSNRRRNKVANILLDYGIRVQYSVFECYEKEDTIKEIHDRIKKEIDEEEDRITFYKACGTCESKIHSLGPKDYQPINEEYLIL